MSAPSRTSTSSATSITGLLGIAFIVLKLTHVIAWSWWWVLAPFWIPFVLVAAVFLVIGLIALFVLVWPTSKKRGRR